jgi:hypothetical protein
MAVKRDHTVLNNRILDEKQSFYMRRLLLFVYQSQEVHLFRPSLGFLVEARRDFKTGEDKRHFLAEVHIKFFRRPHELQNKRHHLFCIYFLTYPTKGG